MHKGWNFTFFRACVFCDLCVFTVKERDTSKSEKGAKTIQFFERICTNNQLAFYCNYEKFFAKLNSRNNTVLKMNNQEQMC